MKMSVGRLMLLAALAMGLAVGGGQVTPAQAQDEPGEPYPGSFELVLGERATVVARAMIQVPVTLTCTMPSVPWETGEISTNASVTVQVTQASGRTNVTGETSLYYLEPNCDGTPHVLLVDVIGDAPFKGGKAIVSAYGGVSFFAWDPQYIELGASDQTGNQVVKLGG